MRTLAIAWLVVSLAGAACAPTPAEGTFATPDEAVQALIDTVKAGDLDALLRLFGPDARDIVASSDPATGRRNQEVFLAAAAQQWRLEDVGADTRELIVGHEDWPFPVPLRRTPDGWRFDAAAGREEILARRIGRNELAAIDVCRAYVAAQQAYARTGHDGNPAGAYAQRIASTPGRQDGLYWTATRGQPRSPLGDLVAGASEDGYDLAGRKSPEPFHGYYFRILTAQGAAAPGGERSYVIDGHMTGGFALIAWPAQYDATGVMSFLVGPDGVVREQDLGPDTRTAAQTVTRFDPTAAWQPAQAGTSAAAR